MNFQNRNSGDKTFVCPNDRQLALRAKLRTGWSCSKVTAPLDHEEQAAIISVIRRNEDLEQAERRRIGRMVERVEKIKKIALDRGPNSCRLCGQTFGLLAGLRRLICEDCQKPVCSKCSIDVNIKSQTKERELWLCRICSETRDMWKKSGAWFFKGIPNYEIPIDEPLPDSKSRPKEMIVKIKARANSISVNTSSSEDDSEDNFHPQISRDSSFRLKMVGSFRNFFENDRKLSAGSVHDRLQNERDTESTSSIVIVKRRESASTISRQNSVSSNLTISESTLGGVNCCNQIQEPRRESLLGWLELTIFYSESNHTLECNVIRARDLPAVDSVGLTDPFCQLNILTPDGLVKYSRWTKTKTVHKTRNPEFNDIVTFLGVEPHELESSKLYVVLQDNDKYGHDFLGAVRIPLNNLQETNRITAPLIQEDQCSLEPTFEDFWTRGKILISLCYNSKKRGLSVLIKQCRNLIPMDSNGSSDPFVKIQLKPDTHKKKYKTSVKWKNLNPVYNEEFFFESSPHDLNKQSLIVTVWDKDIGKSNDFLGSLIVGHNSKGERLKQWLDCVKFPDHLHEKWHFLNADNPL